MQAEIVFPRRRDIIVTNHHQKRRKKDGSNKTGTGIFAGDSQRCDFWLYAPHGEGDLFRRHEFPQRGFSAEFFIAAGGQYSGVMSTQKFENSGQGAAEYILLFGGVIVIALLALTIYRSYMETSDASLKAKDDIIDVRNTILDNRTHV